MSSSTANLARNIVLGIIAVTFIAGFALSRWAYNKATAPETPPVAVVAPAPAPEPVIPPDQLPMKFNATECANGRAYRALTRQEIISASMECKAADMGVIAQEGAENSGFHGNIVCIQCDPNRSYREQPE